MSRARASGLPFALALAVAAGGPALRADDTARAARPGAAVPAAAATAADGGAPGSFVDLPDAGPQASTLPPDVPKDSSAHERALWIRAEAAWQRHSVDEALRAWEEAAQTAADPRPSLLRAARARRARAEQTAARAVSTKATGAAGLLEAAGRDAQSCAEDARRAWQHAAPAAAAAAHEGKAPQEVAALVGAADAEALYLEGVCAGLWARAQGVTPLLERGPELKALFARAAELTPQLDEAGPDRELGRLLAGLPAYAGGDLDEAKLHFERALARGQGAPRTRLAYAEGVAVKAQDRALFKQQLKAVLAGPRGGDDQSADRARDLLAREDELFGPAER